MTKRKPPQSENLLTLDDGRTVLTVSAEGFGISLDFEMKDAYRDERCGYVNLDRAQAIALADAILKKVRP